MDRMSPLARLPADQQVTAEARVQNAAKGLIVPYATKEVVMTASNQNARSNASEEFCEIVEGYSDMVYNIALRILRKPADAEDAVQGAFLSAYRAFESFRGQSKVSTWRYRIVVNACLMRTRKEKNRSRYFMETGYDDAVVVDRRVGPEQAAMDSELHDVLQRGLTLLPPDLRTVIVLKDVQGLSGLEAAEILGITIASFKSRLHRARVLLGKFLVGYLQKDGEPISSTSPVSGPPRLAV